MRLSGKTAIVTGGADGIGKGISMTLAREGARVVVNDISFMAAESVSDKIKDARGEAVPLQADVSRMTDMEKLFEEAVSEFGRVDIFVSNAGVRRDAPLHLMTEAQWDDVLKVQLNGCFNGVKLAQKYMVEQNYGKIIIVASPVPPAVGKSGSINYSAANSGLSGLAASLAVELGRHNINVNCIAPEYIQTAMLRESARSEGMYMDDFKRAVLVKIPLRRLGTPEDVGNLASFLASDESGYISGQTIKISGGVPHA